MVMLTNYILSVEDFIHPDTGDAIELVRPETGRGFFLIFERSWYAASEGPVKDIFRGFEGKLSKLSRKGLKEIEKRLTHELNKVISNGDLVPSPFQLPEGADFIMLRREPNYDYYSRYEADLDKMEASKKGLSHG